MTKIDKYQGFVIEGKGYINDHQMCREVIKFDFPMVDSEKAKECLQLCLNFLISHTYKDFEEECAKKEKENEIKNIITEIIVRTPLKKVPKYKTSEDVDLYCSDIVTNKIYNALKEKDLIK